MPVRTLLGLALVLAALWMPHAAAAQDSSADDATAPKQLTAPYRTAHDKPLEPKQEQVNKAKDHTQYRVEFNGIAGDRVPAYLYVPTGKGPFPAILLQYGSGGSKKTDYIVAIGKQFAGRGYVVLTIDAPGRGERKGTSKNLGVSGCSVRAR
jgi:cephalosporin-C deacetylase-like acetyl esterase